MVGICKASMMRVTTSCFANGAEDVIADHKQGRQDEFEQLIRNGTGQCLSAVPDPADSSLLTAVCYSPAMRLKPGQVNLVGPCSYHPCINPHLLVSVAHGSWLSC